MPTNSVTKTIDMKKTDLTGLSNEELLKEAKRRKRYFGFYLGLILVMVFVSIFSIIEGDIKFATFLPLFFLPIAIAIWKNQRSTEK